MDKFLICGLGNPGDEYEGTRHNTGFMAVDTFAKAMGVTFQDKRYGFVAETSVKGRKVFLLKPTTFMNLSGNAVRYWLNEEKIDQSLMADSHHVSIDAPFQEGEDNSMVDVMAGGEDSRTDRQVDHESMALELDSVLRKVLKDREITIIRECFGISCHEKGLEEIGDQLGLTRERVRQIREKSIAKLRDSGYAKILMKYLG